MAIIVGNDVIAYDHAVKGVFYIRRSKLLAVCYIPFVIG